MDKYTAFNHDCMCLANADSFNRYIKSFDGTDNALPSISVIGEKNTLAEISWFTKDNINHSYFKYIYQPNLSGMELKFSIELKDINNKDDFFNYNELNTNLFITNNNDETYKIDLGFFGEVKSISESIVFNGEVGVTSDIYLKNKYIKRDYPNAPVSNVSLSWVLDGESSEGKAELDFEVLDYKEGIIRLLDNHLIPNGATVFINYLYHSLEKYHIQFSQIYTDTHPNDIDYKKVDVTDIREVRISLGSIHYDYEAKFNDWEVIRGDLNYTSKLKGNDIKTGLNFDKIKHNSVKANINNVLKLGYSKSIFLNVGRGLFANLADNYIDIDNPLSNIFKSWFVDLISITKDKGINDVTIIIPTNLKYLPNELYQKDELGNISSFINPINPSCIDLLVNIANGLKELNDTDISLKFLVEDYCWASYENRPAVFDDYTINLHTREHSSNEEIEEYSLTDYLSEGLSIDDTISFARDLQVCKWLSDKLLDSMFILRERADIEVINHSSCIFSTTLKGNLNKTLDYIDTLYKTSTSLIELSMDFNEFTEVSTDLISKLDNLGYSKERFNFSITNIDDIENINIDTWQIVNDWIHLAYFSTGVTNITINSLYSIIRDDYFLYKPATYVELKNIDTTADIILCRANKVEIGYLSTSKISSLDVSITQTDTLNIKVPFYHIDRFSHKRVMNSFYYDVVEERLIKLNDDYFVIKEVSETDSDTKYKTISCSSLESKLSKSEIRIEATSLQIHSDDDSDDGVLNLLEKETGWKAGYIDPTIKFEKIDNVTVAKYRWFESVTTDWLNFLNNDVAKAFNCVLQYDTTNMTINVYNSNTLGINRGLYLSKNNYIKSKEKKGDTNSIATRLRCFGKDEIDISTVSLNGLNYIEDYSYFIELGDVSDELQIALSKYNQIVIEANTKWKETNTKYISDINLSSTLNYEVKQIEVQIEVLEDMKKAFIEQEDETNANKIEEQIKELQIQLSDLTNTINLLKIDIDNNTKILAHLSNQLDKSKTTDENGELIFTPKLLSELNNFVYWDTFTDTAYDSPEKLLEGGLREMAFRCKPNVSYEIDSINFLEQLLDVNRKVWKEGLYLGDILILQDTDNKTEETLFFVGYSLDFNTKSLKIRISNKKSDVSSTIAISNLLTQSKNVKKSLESKMYLLNKMKLKEEI